MMVMDIRKTKEIVTTQTTQHNLVHSTLGTTESTLTVLETQTLTKIVTVKIQTNMVVQIVTTQMSSSIRLLPMQTSMASTMIAMV